MFRLYTNNAWWPVHSVGRDAFFVARNQLYPGLTLRETLHCRGRIEGGFTLDVRLKYKLYRQALRGV